MYPKVKSMNSDQKSCLTADRINKTEFLSYSFKEFPKPQRLWVLESTLCTESNVKTFS